jgi:hypothetical protein
MVTDIDRLIQQFEAAYTDPNMSLNYAETNIKRAMAKEILMLLDLLEKAEQNQSFGYMRKILKSEPTCTTTVYVDAIDDVWITTGVTND